MKGEGDEGRDDYPKLTAKPQPHRLPFTPHYTYPRPNKATLVEVVLFHLEAWSYPCTNRDSARRYPVLPSFRDLQMELQ